MITDGLIFEICEVGEVSRDVQNARKCVQSFVGRPQPLSDNSNSPLNCFSVPFGVELTGVSPAFAVPDRDFLSGPKTHSGVTVKASKRGMSIRFIFLLLLTISLQNKTHTTGTHRP